MAGERPLRSRMQPPLDVPSAPPSSSAYSMAIPCSRIAVLSEAVLAPGSPEASIGAGAWRQTVDEVRRPLRLAGRCEDRGVVAKVAPDQPQTSGSLRAIIDTE